MAVVTENAPVIGFDVTEVNPSLDVGDMTLRLAVLLTLQFLGMATASKHWTRASCGHQRAAEAGE